ncbi:hypothetical protein NUH30_09195 [Leptospira sp. 85282-16]|uniref:SRPBCC family protein n=1 Tax=Leptospira montravelensis TaxID=2484961 RepID=A0ABY2LQQ9_9LEPT|nr:MULTISPECIES: hypothetical protein [Leptospira]MCT8333847.1 hypothetical protein [Leptospira sp. 85282-16]TGK80251.1 hypothetical protein EHQ19_11200 [Leptospira montravelensis]TGL00421.1 hypothetical protein EHQ31_16625 [Leptospira montravelensis]
MIWYLRVFGVFVLVFAVAILRQSGTQLERTWEVTNKQEIVQKVLYDSFQPKASRLPVVGESWETKIMGEIVKCTTIASNTQGLPEFQISAEGFKHYRILKESYRLEAIQNGVRIHGKWEMETNPNLISKLLFLFFSDADLDHIASGKQKLF